MFLAWKMTTLKYDTAMDRSHWCFPIAACYAAISFSVASSLAAFFSLEIVDTDVVHRVSSTR